jgi:hypothetical protein
MLTASLTTESIDDVLAGTFPASDPPAWTAGIARPAPKRDPRGTTRDGDEPAHTPGVIDVSQPDAAPTFGRSLALLLAAGGIALLIPFVVLALAAPVALSVRGLLEAGRWLLALVG